jgi:hypothetical protein
VSSFEFVTVLVSVIVGLAVTHLLTGLGRAVHLRQKASLWWVHLLWTATVFVYLALHWWALFYLRDESTWNFWVFLYILIHSVLLFFLAVLLYRPDPDGVLDHRATFELNRSWFFGVFAVALLADIGTTAIEGNLWDPWYVLPVILHLAALAAVGAVVPSTRYQKFLVIYFFAVFVGWGVMVRGILARAA